MLRYRHLLDLNMTPIRELDATGVERLLPDLADLLVDAVHGGASVGFLAPLSIDEASRYWQGVADALAQGGRVMLVAEREGMLVGTIQLDLCQKANGVNRAEIQKLLVHSRARRGGVARALVAQAESRALDLRRGLLYLDTLAGSGAEGFYQACGYQKLGDLPGYASDTAGVWNATAIYYKTLFDAPPLVRG
jgi:acetyltransferase